MSNIEMFQQLNQVAETVEEGFLHISARIAEGEISLDLAADVIEGFAVVEQVLEGFASEAGGAQESTRQLHHYLQQWMTAYEQGDAVQIGNILNLNIIPVVKEWRSRLEQLQH
ncbi:hypothetical protein [Paenibacillus physcomitrellae]|uniref:DUF8042 domain-containing protein n=1 Tax=Paenibacillus physcomitrellae TaxID=1619311 RepID=A0ABQ1GH91_9BACL|nr:hypothetical protein [Paenibacillus physcomitrellae]GGA43648.1 hypothetical protein GCM10010917_31190 [Paenibacillus physcomitrellae]